MTTWRDIIAKAGGVESAMLYGPAVVALVKEFERLEEVAELRQRAANAGEVATRAAGERAAEADRLLAVERAEVVRLSNLVDPITRRLAAVEEVVAAAYNESRKGVVTARLTAALAALDKEAV